MIRMWELLRYLDVRTLNYFGVLLLFLANVNMSTAGEPTVSIYTVSTHAMFPLI